MMTTMKLWFCWKLKGYWALSVLKPKVDKKRLGFGPEITSE